jgi:TrmH family RNA methyltransferase
MDSVASNYVIRSRQNAGVKALRQAFANNGRIDGSRVAIEGEHLLEEAIRSGLIFEQVFVREDSLPHFRSLWNTRSSAALPPLHILAPDIFDGAVATEAPQGIAAFVRMPIQSLGDVWSVPSPLLLVLEGIQDPGNLGTILRAAEAFGTRAVFALPGTASPWNLKAVRASAGSVFRLPVFPTSLAGLAELQNHNVRLCAAVARDGATPEEIPWSSSIALCVGNEGRGLTKELLSQATDRVTIRSSGAVESLNAAVAASILLYEAARHRATRQK